VKIVEKEYYMHSNQQCFSGDIKIIYSTGDDIDTDQISLVVKITALEADDVNEIFTSLQNVPCRENENLTLLWKLFI